MNFRQNINESNSPLAKGVRGIDFALLIIFIFALTSSCNNTEKESPKKIKQGKYSDNELFLISGHDSLPVIDFSPKDSIKVLIDKIKSACSKDIPFGKVNYKIPIEIDSMEVVNVRFQTDFSYRCNMRVSFISYNRNKQILFEGELIEKDEFIEKLSAFYNNGLDEDYSLKDKFEREPTSILWDIEINKSDFDEFLTLIIDWYLSEIETISHNEFKKSIQKLNEEELTELKEQYPLNILVEEYEIVKRAVGDTIIEGIDLTM